MTADSDAKSAPTAPGPAAGRGAQPARTRPAPLALSIDAVPQPKDLRNPDPYNTSGSFDRTKNWARVGKR